MKELYDFTASNVSIYVIYFSNSSYEKKVSECVLRIDS